MSQIFIIIISSAISLLAGCDNSPKSYDDCILQNMSEVKSDKGALLVMRSCREKFPKGSEKINIKTRELTGKELALLDGRAGLSGNYFRCMIYNGNNKLTLTELRVIVETTISKEQESREYANEVTIPPLSTEDVYFNIFKGDQSTDYSWSIAGARGYKE